MPDIAYSSMFKMWGESMTHIWDLYVVSLLAKLEFMSEIWWVYVAVIIIIIIKLRIILYCRHRFRSNKPYKDCRS